MAFVPEHTSFSKYLKPLLCGSISPRNLRGSRDNLDADKRLSGVIQVLLIIVVDKKSALIASEWMRYWMPFSIVVL